MDRRERNRNFVFAADHIDQRCVIGRMPESPCIQRTGASFCFDQRIEIGPEIEAYRADRMDSDAAANRKSLRNIEPARLRKR